MHYSIKSSDSGADAEVLFSTRSSEGGAGAPLAFMLEKGVRAPRAWEIALAGAAWAITVMLPLLAATLAVSAVSFTAELLLPHRMQRLPDLNHSPDVVADAAAFGSLCCPALLACCCMLCRCASNLPAESTYLLH